ESWIPMRRCSGESTRKSPPKDHQAWPPRLCSPSWSTRTTRLPAWTSSAVATSPARPAPTTTTSASMPRLCQRLGTDLGLLVPLLHDLALGEGLGAGLGARL